MNGTFVPRGVTGRRELVETLAEVAGSQRRIGEAFDAAQDLLGAQGLCWTGRDLDQEVEVVGEDGEGEGADPAEAVVLAEQANERFPLLGTQDEVAVHDPRQAVVVGYGKRGGAFRRCWRKEGGLRRIIGGHHRQIYG